MTRRPSRPSGPLRLFALIVACVLPACAPAAGAAPSVQPGTVHAGDVYVYDVAWHDEGAQAGTVRYTVLEPQPYHDAAGRQHVGAAVEAVGAHPGVPGQAQRCHAAPGGFVAARVDVAGANETAHVSRRGTVIVTGVWNRPVEERLQLDTRYAGPDCLPALPLGLPPLRAGDPVPAALLPPGVDGVAFEATKWQGRPALRYAWGDDASESRTVADGVPVFVAWAGRHPLPDGGSTTVVRRLVQATPGTGAAQPDPAPGRAEAARPATAAFDGQRWPTAGLGLPLPYEEAWAAWQREPACARALAAGTLFELRYDGHPVWNDLDDVRTEGGWEAHLWTDDGPVRVAAARVVGVGTPAGPVPVAPTVATDCVQPGHFRPEQPPAPPPRVPAPQHLAALLAAEGMGPLQTLRYEQDGASFFLAVSDVSSTGGEDAAAGHLLVVGADGLLGARYARQTVWQPEGLRGGVLEAPAQAPAPPPATGLPPASRPVAAGLAAAAAAGLAFWLLFLFTRLRPDRLLDHPTRALLADAVRADPGVHQAQLVAVAGIGEGATRRHLRRLVSAGLLQAVRGPHHVRYFPGDLAAGAVRRTALLRTGSLARVQRAALAHPNDSVRALARRLGLAPATVHAALRRLRAAGLLDAEGTAVTP